MTDSELTASLRETLAVFDGEASGTPLTTTEVADRLDLGRRSTYERLERLVDQERLQTKKVGARGRVWWRATVPPGDRRPSAPPPDASGSLVDVLDSADVGVFVLDEDFDVAWVNDATGRYFGVDRSDLVGRDKRALVEDRIAPTVEESAGFAETVLATYRDNTYPERFECHVTAGEGRTERWLEHRSRPIETGRYAGGRVELYYDVTDQKRSERVLAETERRFQSLVQAVEEYAIFLLDADGRVRTWNEGAARITGYERDRIVGEHVSTFYTEGDRADDVPGQNLAAAARHGSIKDEGWRVRADGTDLWAHVSISAIYGDDGSVEGYAKVTRDMTDRREREQDIRRERDLLAGVLEGSPTGVGIFDGDGEALRVNQRFVDLLGLDLTDPEEYVLGDHPLHDEDGDEIPYEDRPAARALSAGEHVTNQWVRVDGHDDRTRWLSVNAEPLTGDTDGVVVTVGDVTQLKEQARRLERQRDDLRGELEEVFERIDDGFFALDPNLRFTALNERAADLLDRSPGELVGEYVGDAFDLGATASGALEDALETQESTSFEEYFEPLGTWFEANVYPSETGVSVYLRDVTRRKERERQLQEYKHIVETVEDGIYVLDEDLRIQLVNEAATSMTGYSREDLVGSHVSSVVEEDAVDASRVNREQLLESDERAETTEVTLQTADGETRTVEARYTLLSDAPDEFRGTVGVVRDVTERKEYEKELERYATIVETIWDGVYALDPDERFVMANETFLEMTGYDRDELLGRPGSLVHDEMVNERASELSESVVDGEREGAVLEFDLETADGETLPVESRFGPYRFDEDQHARTGVVRDVTDRKARERALEVSERRYRALAENFPNGVVALFDENLEYTLMDGKFFETVDVEPEDFVGRQVAEEFVPSDVRDAFRTNCRAALTGESAEFEVEYDEYVFDVWVAPVTDENGHIFGGMLMAQDVTDRVAYERLLERQRERLTALDDLNGVFRDVTDAVVEQSTREQIEAIVCERLAESDSYTFAWVGDVDVQTQTVNCRTGAGTGDYPDGPIPVDLDGGSSDGPTGRAIVEREVQTTRDEPQAESDRGGEATSSAVVPIVHGDTFYGVLTLHADRPDAFTDDERAVVGQLGEVVGHAIAAVERKRALISEEVVELEFQIQNVFDVLGGDAETDDPIEFERTVPVGEDSYLVYGTAGGDAIDAMRAAVESEAYEHWEGLNVLDEGDEGATFELRLTEPLFSALAAHGGYMQEARIVDGNYYMRVHLAPRVNVREIVDTITDVYPTIELVTQRQVTRSEPSSGNLQEAIFGALTDRQQSAIRAAYQRGYFAWPRESTGEEIAGSLDVTAPTFHQHLRKAENKLFTALFDGGVTAE
ncbi:PAS domain S-box protein [Haloarchaeobius sp. HRN-SO-5]|uniref:PAS domain S-box protein n=1 Tax=Haloarchaeobius sp. HRN-SO-5 TaxID=3446118 RepID=UPI003EB9DDD8